MRTSTTHGLRPKAAGYGRVSRLPEDERETKISPDMQRGACDKQATRYGYDLIWFEDLDYSGKDTNRPKYQEMMGRVDVGEFVAVITCIQSRITRDTGDLQEFRKRLKRQKVLFLDRDGPVDLQTPSGNMLSTIEGAVDRREREEIGVKVADALAQKVAKGGMVGRLPPGYVNRKEFNENGSVKNSRIEVHHVDGPIIQAVYGEYTAGGHSFKSLARSLNERGIARPQSPHLKRERRTGSRWSASDVRDLLSNPRYRGVVIRNDQREFPGSFPALVDADTWNKAVRLRMDRRLRIAPKGRRYKLYVLRGLLHCPCGAPLRGRTVSRSSGRHSYYVCVGRHEAGTKCRTPCLPQALTEARVLEVLTALAMPDGLADSVDAAIASYATRERVTSRAGRRRTIQERLARTNELYIEGHMKKADFEERIAELGSEQNLLDFAPKPSRIAEQRDKLRSIVQDWSKMDDEEQQRLLRFVFRGIRASYDRKTGLSMSLDVRPEWQPYVDAVLAAEKRPPPAPIVAGPERETGLKGRGVATVRLTQDERGWLRLAV